MDKKELGECKSKLKKILEESEIIRGTPGKETNIDDHIVYEIKEKAPEYLAQPHGNDYSKMAERALINFCNSKEVFEKPDGSKFVLFERFSVHSYRYFVSEGIE